MDTIKQQEYVEKSFRMELSGMDPRVNEAHIIHILYSLYRP